MGGGGSGVTSKPSGSGSISSGGSKVTGNQSKIHQDKQDKHIEGTPNYNQQVSNGKKPSILTENAQDLLEKFGGTQANGKSY